MNKPYEVTVLIEVQAEDAEEAQDKVIKELGLKNKVNIAAVIESVREIQV